MFKFVVVFFLLAMPLSVMADQYKVSVTREDSNIYRVVENNMYIITKYCYEYVYSEDAILDIVESAGSIKFIDSDNECVVCDILEDANLNPGTYEIMVSRKEDNLYEVFGKNLIIKTFACYSFAIGQQTVFISSGGGFGSIYLDGQKHMVNGVYSRVALK